MATQVQVFIFDRSGNLLADIQPQLNEVTWRLNDVGQTQFFLSYKDPRCTPDNLRYGNLCLFRFGNGLPDWGGVIDPPRAIGPDGVRATAYTGERLFYFRQTPTTLDYTSVSPGYIYSDLIARLNADEPTVLITGDIYTGGTTRSITYHGQNMLTIIRELAANSGEDFAVNPYYSGTMSLEGYWYETRGTDKNGEVLFAEGLNVGRGNLDEQGRIVNELTFYGAGNTWDGNRLSSTQIDADSLNQYGLRQFSQVKGNIKDQGTLDEDATQNLGVIAAPQTRLTVEGVVNCDPASFASYDIGDIVRLELFLRGGDAWAEQGNWRIIGRGWQPGNDTLRLELQET